MSQKYMSLRIRQRFLPVNVVWLMLTHADNFFEHLEWDTMHVRKRQIGDGQSVVRPSFEKVDKNVDKPSPPPKKKKTNKMDG